MNAHWLRYARLATLGTAVWLVLAACGGPAAPTTIGGTLNLSVEGLPASATPSVRITGPSGYDATFTSDASVALPPGSYAVIPGPVSNASAIYRAATRAVDVVANATSSVTITYAQPSVLFYYDSLGTADDNVTPALTANGFDVTFTTSTATFDTEASSGGHDLVIAMAQGVPPAFDLATLAAYVDGGGRAIGADFGGTAGFADVFDAGFTGETNLTTADLDAPALSSGITNPIVLDNPTYITYSTGLSAEVGGSSLCTFENGDSCLVLGNSGRTALLGFVMDTVPGADEQTFWENLTLYVLGF